VTISHDASRTKADRDKKPECGWSKVGPPLPPKAIVRWRTSVNGNSKFEALLGSTRLVAVRRMHIPSHALFAAAYL